MDQVPARPLPPPPAKATKSKPANQTQWKKWLIGDAYDPPPGAGGYPTKAAYAAISKLPPKDSETALSKIVRTTQELLQSGNLSARDAEAWLEAVGRSACRRLEFAKELVSPEHTATLSELLVSLAKVAKLDKSPDALLRLVRELAPSALEQTGPSQAHLNLDRLLDALLSEERIKLMGDLIVQSAGESIFRGRSLAVRWEQPPHHRPRASSVARDCDTGVDQRAGRYRGQGIGRIR